jgi:hypothetical protein
MATLLQCPRLACVLGVVYRSRPIERWPYESVANFNIKATSPYINSLLPSEDRLDIAQLYRPFSLRCYGRLTRPSIHPALSLLHKADLDIQVAQVIGIM